MASTPGNRLCRFDVLNALYGDEPMAGIWSERRTVQGWLDVESELAQAQAEAGVLDQVDADLISAAVVPGADRIADELRSAMLTDARQVG